MGQININHHHPLHIPTGTPTKIRGLCSRPRQCRQEEAMREGRRQERGKKEETGGRRKERVDIYRSRSGWPAGWNGSRTAIGRSACNKCRNQSVEEEKVSKQSIEAKSVEARPVLLQSQPPTQSRQGCLQSINRRRARVSLTLRLICGYLLRSLQPFLTCIYETLLDI